MSKGQSLQDPFLNMLRKERVPVSIFLVNGIKLQGQIESFDQEDGDGNPLLSKHVEEWILQRLSLAHDHSPIRRCLLFSGLPPGAAGTV